MSVEVDGGPVEPWVQACADGVNELTGIKHIMTYAGHQDFQTEALDIFATRAQGDRIAQYLIDNWDYFGLKYIMWQRKIYNPSIAPYWRDVPDRHSPTQNHEDHLHATFKRSGAARPGNIPQGDEDMAFTDEYKKHLDEILAKFDYSLNDPDGGIHKRLEIGEYNDISTNEALGRIEMDLRDPDIGMVGRVKKIERQQGEILAILQDLQRKS